jgi:hypothetical protein
MNCVIAGCGRSIDRKWCLCAEHWRIVPVALRVELSRAYNPHLALEAQASGFGRACWLLQKWFVETFGEVDDRRPRRSWAELVVAIRRRDAERKARRTEGAAP